MKRRSKKMIKIEKYTKNERGINIMLLTGKNLVMNTTQATIIKVQYTDTIQLIDITTTTDIKIMDIDIIIVTATAIVITITLLIDIMSTTSIRSIRSIRNIRNIRNIRRMKVRSTITDIMKPTTTIRIKINMLRRNMKITTIGTNKSKTTSMEAITSTEGRLTTEAETNTIIEIRTTTDTTKATEETSVAESLRPTLKEEVERSLTATTT
jgi:hypothetical protein